MGIDELVAPHRDAILRTAARYGASNIRVFGSVARGEAGAASDVDFLMDLSPGWGLALMGLWLDLEDLLGRKVDIVEEENLHWYIRDQVLQEARPL